MITLLVLTVVWFWSVPTPEANLVAEWEFEHRENPRSFPSTYPGGESAPPIELSPLPADSQLLDGFLLHFVPEGNLAAFWKKDGPDTTIVERTCYMYPILAGNRCVPGVLVWRSADLESTGFEDQLACMSGTLRDRVADKVVTDIVMVRSGDFGTFLIRTANDEVSVSPDGWTLFSYRDFVQNIGLIDR